MVNTLVRPVISKIFMMRGSATTMCRSPPSFPAPLERAHQHAEGGGVEEGHPQQVEDDGRLALGDDTVQALAQLRGGRDVDLPADGDHRRRCVRPFLYLELLIHSTLLRPSGCSRARPGICAMAIGQSVL